MLLFENKYIKVTNLINNFNLYLINKKAIIILKGLYGLFKIKLPSYYFFYKNNNIISFLFINKERFINFIKLFYNYYKYLFIIYYVKIRIKGLGYRIRKISNQLYYFFFNYTNMYYINIPKNILVKWYKKRMILISNNFFLLKLLFSNILLLKKIGPYRIRGLKYPRQIILLKKSVKKL